ncbi:MAG: hypothetical protein IT579_06425, partial [Verrucomicrobia subdivision 3 bacterium]|nr:hypothetical protein [Limisphaerales bacterium]
TQYGKPSLLDQVLLAYREGVSTEGRNPAQNSAVLALLCAPDGHAGVKLDRDSLDRFVTWIDTYGQRQGSFSEDQEQRLVALRDELTASVWLAVPAK